MTESNKIHFKKNMALLKKNHPEIFKMVSNINGSLSEAKLVFSENKKPNLKVKTTEKGSVYIHNHEDPGAESEAFLSMVKDNSTGVVLMLGMGLGYLVLELLKKRKKLQYVIIFELNIEFFVQALKNMDLTELLMEKRVMICLGEPEDLSSFMAPANKALMLEDVHTLNLKPCFMVNPAGYEKLSSIVFDYINALNTEGATKTAHGGLFFENRLKHLTSMHHDKKLEDLAGRFKGVPALIIAAGPSLDKNIDQISKAIGKAIIISADTALPNLLAHGVEPNFLTSIDYKDLTYEKISGSASNPAVRQINLICTSWVAGTVTKQFPANTIFWAFNDNPLENWINLSMGGRMFIGGAGTVAHLNFIAAQIMGCDPIVFVGQDLAFTNNSGHSSNVVLTSDETTKKKLDSSKDIMWVKGVVESKVPTNRQMYGYKQKFEQMIKSSKEKVINSTEGGALIEGAENMPLSQVIDRFCKDRVDFVLNDVYGKASLLKSMESMTQQISKLEKIIQKAEKLSGPVKKELADLKKHSQRVSSFSNLPGKLKKKISDLDVCHKKADGNSLWPLFNEMTMEGLRHNERERQEIEKLEGLPDKYFEWLERSLVRIDKVNKIRIVNLGKLKKELNELISYHKSETLQFERLEKDETDLNAIFDLATLYSETKNYVLLERMLDRYASNIEDSAEIQYQYGTIALHRGDYEAAENRFQIALTYDAAFVELIDKKRKEIADYYWKLAKADNLITVFGSRIKELLLLKGLKCWPEHEAIKNEFKLFGENLLNQRNYKDALYHFHQALSVMPDNIDAYITLADIYFTLEDFDSGLKYLKKAVSIDKKYAVYWYNMGKNLQSQKDYNGAILAYEQYFVALPENISVLKDIGDCYTKLGNTAAAQEAYLQFKKKQK